MLVAEGTVDMFEYWEPTVVGSHDDGCSIPSQKTSRAQGRRKTLGICVGIESFENIVQQDDGRPVVERPSKSNTLFLAAAERDATTANDAGITLGELTEVVIELTGRHNFSVFPGMVRRKGQDVVPNRLVEQPGVLAAVGDVGRDGELDRPGNLSGLADNRLEQTGFARGDGTDEHG